MAGASELHKMVREVVGRREAAARVTTRGVRREGVREKAAVEVKSRASEARTKKIVGLFIVVGALCLSRR